MTYMLEYSMVNRNSKQNFSLIDGTTIQIDIYFIEKKTENYLD